MKNMIKKYRNDLRFILIILASGVIGKILSMDMFEVVIIFMLYYILQINDKIKGK